MRLITVIANVTFGVLIFAQEHSIQTGKPVGGTPQSLGATNKPKPFVQISSVSVTPKVIHRVGEPVTATITVQVFSFGLEQVAKPQITVRVGTATVSDPKVNVEYLDSPKTRRLNVTPPAVFEFEVRAPRETIPGDISMKADIIAATSGIVVRDSDPPDNGLTNLKIE